MRTIAFTPGPCGIPWRLSNYRRPFAPGGTFFFTVTTNGRQPVLTEPPILAALHEAVRETHRTLPFTILAWVVLPDHLHAIWELPPGDADFSLRWARIKQAVTRVYTNMSFAQETRSPSRTKRREGTLWQRRFWEHQIRDEIDLVRHVEYIHYNPVKPGHVARVRDWPHSTFHKYVRTGIYPQQWETSDMSKGRGTTESDAVRKRTLQLLIIGFLLTPDTYGASVKQVVPGDKIKTVAGQLKVTKTWFDDHSWINRVFLNGKVIFEDSENEGPISIEATYPTTVPVDLVLLGIVEGGSACPMILRVLEIKAGGKYHFSNEFGNCLPPADTTWFKLLKENPSYQDGEWHIALPTPGTEEVDDAAKRTEFEWYIYRDGNITKRTVK